jgi:hypothetical protein
LAGVVAEEAPAGHPSPTEGVLREQLAERTSRARTGIRLVIIVSIPSVVDRRRHFLGAVSVSRPRRASMDP